MTPNVGNPLPSARADDILPNKQRIFLLALRQSIIIFLGALEDYLEMDRSIVPKHKRVNA